jgi:uncharacterized DUF497 family protein
MTTCEWDPRKDALNRRKHGVAFATAATIFDDPFALMAFDRNLDGEDRWRMIGRATDEATLVVAFVIRNLASGDTSRIISARRSLRHERLGYEQQAH